MAPGSADRYQLCTAMRHLLHGLEADRPLLILDDVQWADLALWPLLKPLSVALAETPVPLVVSGRDGELCTQPAWSTLRAWDRAGAPVMRLGP